MEFSVISAAGFVVLQAAGVDSCGFCLNGGEFVGLLKGIFLLTIFFSGCSDVLERIYICVYVHICRYMKSGVFLDRCPPCMHSWVNPPEFAGGVYLPSQLDLGIPCLHFPSIGSISGSLHPPRIYMGSEDPNSGLHICTTSPLNTELPLHP